METKATFNRHLRRDFILIVLNVITAVVVSRLGLFELLLTFTLDSEYIMAFVAGIFFTSFFTTPFAIAVFLALAPEMNIPLMIGIGAIGALCGDLLLFNFIRHTFKDDVDYLLKKKRIAHRFAAVFRRRVFRWVLPFVGALIIASPLPDELGIGMMGVSSMKITTLLPVSFAMNALGISLIALLA